MPRTIVCTTGTSIGAGLRYDDRPDAYQLEIRKRISQLSARCVGIPELLAEASAETHSLSTMKVDPEDEVVLLTSETPAGAICAEEIKKLLEDQCGIPCEILPIAGLQVTDAVRFRRQGVQNLFEGLDRRCGEQRSSGRETVLNITGGFKSVVPYVTLYGLLNQHKVVYLFEHSDSLLHLPPVPLNFDYERLAQAMDALQLLEREVVTREQFFRAIPGLEFQLRDWYECLVEEADGLVTLSAFGSLLLKQRETHQLPVFLSPSAERQYSDARGDTKEQFTFMLERVADPLWRMSKRHPFPSTDLIVYKPGNTSERMACFLRSERIHVCELMRHDEYERVLPGRREDQYSLKEFKPWVRPGHVPESPSSEEQAYRKLREGYENTLELLNESILENERLVARHESQAERMSREIEATTARAASDEQALRGARSEVDVLQREVADLEMQAHTLRDELARSRRPWWMKLIRPR